MARRAVATAARAAPARRAPLRRPPRRVSGPVAGGAVALPGRVLRAPFARAARSRAGSILDALLQGSAWIALVAVLLVGIVFFNVDLLELNRDIAHTSDKAARLKRENAGLRLQVARLASSERIQRVAAQRGLELPAPGEVRYLRLDAGLDARRAAGRATEPGPGGATPVRSGTPAGSAPASQATPAPPTQTQPQAAVPAPQARPAPATTAPAGPPPTTTSPAGPPAGGAAPAPAPATGTGG